MRKFDRFWTRSGVWGLLRLAAYPISTLFSTPVRFFQAIYSCRILLKGNLKRFNRFTPRSGVNSLFYWSAAVNLMKHGRRGVVPNVGTGNYPLSNWFFFSLPSLFGYYKLTPLLPLIGISGWLLSHLVWLEILDPGWVLIVVSLVLCSTSFYGNMFVLQNYNAAGWLFFPVAVFGLLTGQWFLAGVAWILASFGSITVVFTGGLLCLGLSVWSLDPWPLLTVIPAGLKVMTHLLPVFSQKMTVKNALLDIMKAIGMTGKNVRYKRVASKRIGISESYMIILYLQFLAADFVLRPGLNELYILGIGIFILNATIVRFADFQSVLIMMLTLSVATVLTSSDPLILPFFWLVISPLPVLAGINKDKIDFDIVTKAEPFEVSTLLDDMSAFLSPVEPGKRVLMAFDDPHDVYDNLFDGYRSILEVPLYVAAQRGIHFMPDWWAIFELNQKGAPDFWGRDVASVSKNIAYWKADFVVIYQETGTPLAGEWVQNGFQEIGILSWAKYGREFRGMPPFQGETPDWFLLSLPKKADLSQDRTDRLDQT